MPTLPEIFSDEAIRKVAAEHEAYMASPEGQARERFCVELRPLVQRMLILSQRQGRQLAQGTATPMSWSNPHPAESQLADAVGFDYDGLQEELRRTPFEDWPPASDWGHEEC